MKKGISTRESFKRGYGYNVHCNSSIMYKRPDGKTAVDKLDTVPKWVNVLDKYDSVPNVHAILEKFMKSPMVVDPMKPKAVDLTLECEQPMLFIMYNKMNKSDKIVCYAERTYFAKIDSRANDLTTCIPLFIDEDSGDLTMSMNFFFMSSRKFPGNRYSRNQGGVWFNFKLLEGWGTEAIIALFDLEKALKAPKTVYHELYPQEDPDFYTPNE